jgi:hypothetical protein
MATRPIICPPSNFPGFVFYKDKFVLEEGNTKTPFFDLSSLLLGVSAYSRLKITLQSSTSVLLSQTDLVDNDGFVRWIAIKAVYPPPISPILYNAEVPVVPGLPRPTNGTPQNQKYLTWTYEGNTYPLGELMILSGNPAGSIDADAIGWNLSSQDIKYSGGGITITNPHDAMTVKLEIMVAR